MGEEWWRTSEEEGGGEKRRQGRGRKGVKNGGEIGKWDGQKKGGIREKVGEDWGMGEECVDEEGIREKIEEKAGNRGNETKDGGDGRETRKDKRSKEE